MRFSFFCLFYPSIGNNLYSSYTTNESCFSIVTYQDKFIKLKDKIHFAYLCLSNQFLNSKKKYNF